MDVVTVYPEKGMNSIIARRLLAAADHPNQVKVVTNPRFGYQVPADVYERFEAAVAEPEEAAEPKTFTDGDTNLAALKKRGRPKKSQPAKAVEGEEK